MPDGAGDRTEVGKRPAATAVEVLHQGCEGPRHVERGNVKTGVERFEFGIAGGTKVVESILDGFEQLAPTQLNAFENRDQGFEVAFTGILDQQLAVAEDMVDGSPVFMAEVR